MRQSLSPPWTGRTPRNPRILLVDGEPNLLEGFRLGLRRGPYEVLCARSAQEAFGILRRQDIDVLITDEQLPGRSGWELLAFVARYAPSTTRVLLTGYPTLEPADQAIKTVQIFRLLRKPFPIGRLVTVIEEALRSRRAGFLAPRSAPPRDHPGQPPAIEPRSTEPVTRTPSSGTLRCNSAVRG